MPKVSGGGATNHFPQPHNFQGRRFLDHLPGLIREEMVEERSLYQCFHAKVKGGRIYCEKGHRFESRRRGKRTLSIDGLARGVSLVFSMCEGCIDYEPMGDPIPPEERGWIRYESNRSPDI